MLAFSCILQRIFCRRRRILYNAHVHACCIRHNSRRTFLHTKHKVLLLYHFLNSLTALQHNIPLRIPYKAECISPSSLHHLPVHHRLHNDYTVLHNLNRHQYMFYNRGNFSYGIFLVDELHL
jgi:hypothetical protein